MKQRYNMPFGYKMENGTMLIKDREASVVRDIFRLYLEGTSYSDIAETITIPYIEGKPWNKNMVAQILENRRYLGTDSYPAIVTQQEFEQVATKKLDKYTRKNRVVPELAKSLTGRVFCERWDEKSLNLTVYDDKLVRRLIDTIKVLSSEKILVIFKGGAEIEQTLQA